MEYFGWGLAGAGGTAMLPTCLRPFPLNVAVFFEFVLSVSSMLPTATNRYFYIFFSPEVFCDGNNFVQCHCLYRTCSVTRRHTPTM